MSLVTALGSELELEWEWEWEWEFELEWEQLWGMARRPAREVPDPDTPPGGMLTSRQTRLESQVAEASQCA
jgi:hypothetical protein